MPTSPPPSKDVREVNIERAARQIVFTLAEAIKDIQSIPNGHLYVMVMGKMSFELYTSVIGQLKARNLIVEKFNLLTWIGPADWTFDAAMQATDPKPTEG